MKIPGNKGFDKSNNGYDLNSPEVDRLIAVRPNEVQLFLNDLEYYSFIHYGMNTFNTVEWGSGKEDEKLFNPKSVDTDQWAKVLKDSGSKGVILTAKHHDGFCLFQTKYTEHSIKNSPYKDGKGDIVKELSDSCRKYGLLFGIYLSPWDRNSPLYGHDEYNDYFCNQLTELCTNYGEIFCFWFDGAKGKEAPDFEYDWDRYFKLIRSLQPGAIIANCGPDVRWIGNEAGVARKSEWSVVTDGQTSIEQTMANSQQGADDTKKLQLIDHQDADMGSRELVKNYAELKWYPAESDVSIHTDWFYQPKHKARGAKKLAKIYFATVGGNASLLMNVPPSQNGIIEPDDVETLKEFRRIIDSVFTNKISYKAEAGGKDITADITTPDGSCRLTEGMSTVSFNFKGRQDVKTIVLREDVAHSQRIEAFEVYAKCSFGYRKISSCTVIGSKKIIRLKRKVSTDEIRIVFTQSRSWPYLREVEFFAGE